MKEIKMLVENIGEELGDARKYAKLALKYKSEDPDMANLFYKLAGEEMGHMNALHQCAVTHIEAYWSQSNPIGCFSFLQDTGKLNDYLG